MEDVSFLAKLVHRGHLSEADARALMEAVQAGEDLDGLLIERCGWDDARVRKMRRTNAGEVPEIPGFQVGPRLGVGGTAEVFRAKEAKTGKTYALKVLSPRSTRDDNTRKAFVREGKLLAALEHPGLVRGFGVARSGATYFSKLAWVDGKTLLELLDDGRAFSEDEALRIILSAAEVLAYLESQGLVHRDVKPGNIMLDREGKVVLIDLGFAAAGAEEASADSAVGTVQYLSPEQARGGAAADCRSDIYSLGLSLFHIVVGRLPFEADDDREVLRMQVMDSLNAPELRARDISPHLHYFISKMVAKDVNDRYQSFAELIEDVRGHLAGREDMDLGRPGADGPNRKGGSQRFRRRGRARTAVLGVLAAVAAGFGGYFAARAIGARTPHAEEVEPVRPEAPIASPSERSPLPVAREETSSGPSKRTWVEQNNRANALLEDGELEAAIELFAGCVEAVPEDDVFRRNLAEARFRLASRHYGDGDLAGAIAELERAVETAPERDELVRELARWKRELELAENDTFAPGAYFRIEYDGSRADVVQHVQEVLDFLEGGGRYNEGAYEMLRGAFRADPVLTGGDKIRVVLYDRAEFDKLTGLGDWAGGVFDGVIRVAVDDLLRERPRWERILRHELVHAFVRHVGGRDVPGWLNEGLAQVFEEPTLDLPSAYATLEGHTLFPLERLQESLATWSDKEEITRAYAQSLAFVAFLRETVGDSGIVELLAACKRGEPADAISGVPLDAYLSDLATKVGATL